MDKILCYEGTTTLEFLIQHPQINISYRGYCELYLESGFLPYFFDVRNVVATQDLYPGYEINFDYNVSETNVVSRFIDKD